MQEPSDTKRKVLPSVCRYVSIILLFFRTYSLLQICRSIVIENFVLRTLKRHSTFCLYIVKCGFKGGGSESEPRNAIAPWVAGTSPIPQKIEFDLKIKKKILLFPVAAYLRRDRTQNDLELGQYAT